jgi:O-antigen/teichoic acid export membrane protein
MNNTGRTIAKNASVLMASQIITWGLAILLTIFLPRYLGAAAIGKFHLANSLWAIIGIVAAFGMDMMITKEVARSPEKSGELFGTTLYLRTALFALGSLVIVAYGHIAGYPAETLYVIYIIGFVNFIAQFTIACDAVLIGFERMEFVSIGSILGKAANTFIVILMLILQQGLIVIAVVGIIGAFLQLAFTFNALRRLAALKLRFQWHLAKWMLKESFSYLMVRFALVVYQQIDIVIISLLVTEKNMGWYGTADQLFGTFLFVPSVFITALYPALSRLFKSEPNSVNQIIRKSFDLMWLMAVPIGLGVLLIADPLVVLLYGEEFTQAGPVLAVMGIVLLLTYQNMLLGQFLISTDRQRAWSWTIGACALLTIPLDIFFVSLSERFFGIGAMGGAFSFTVTEIVMLCTALLLLPKGTLDRQNAYRAIRVLLAGLIMVGVAWWVRDLFILVPIITAAATYLLMIVILRAVPREDWVILRSMVENVLARVRRRQIQPANVPGEN